MVSRKLILNRTQRVIGPQTFSPVGCDPDVAQSGQVPGSLGLRDFEHSHDVANAEFAMIQQKPEHLQARFVRQSLKKTSCFLHVLLPCGYMYISGLPNGVKVDCQGIITARSQTNPSIY